MVRNSVVGGYRNETLTIFNASLDMSGTYICYCKLSPENESWMSKSIVRVHSKTYHYFNVLIF